MVFIDFLTPGKVESHDPINSENTIPRLRRSCHSELWGYLQKSTQKIICFVLKMNVTCLLVAGFGGNGLGRVRTNLPFLPSGTVLGTGTRGARTQGMSPLKRLNMTKPQPGWADKPDGV